MVRTRNAARNEHTEVEVAMVLAEILPRLEARLHPCPHCACPECQAVKALLAVLQSDPAGESAAATRHNRLAFLQARKKCRR